MPALDASTPTASTIPLLAPSASDLLHLAPEAILAGWGLLVLVVDFAILRRSSPADRSKVLGTVSLAGVLVALVGAFWPEFAGRGPADPLEPSVLFGSMLGGPLVERLNALILVLLGLSVAISSAWNFTEHWGEYFALTLWAGVGAMLLVGSSEMISLFLALELMTICFYLLSAFEKGNARSPEAGLKYFVYGSVSSAILLFGLSWIYGLTGSTRFDAIGRALAADRSAGDNLAAIAASLMILVGFGFKLAAAPFHQWAPDAYEGAPAPVAGWLSTGSKVASVVALLKVVTQSLGPLANARESFASPGIVGFVGLIAAASMTFGNLAALGQRNFKRLLAYSSIAHAGYILVGVLAAVVATEPARAAGATLFYLAIYAFPTLGGFALAAWLYRDGRTDQVDDLDGLAARSPVLAGAVVISMLSLIGLPPFAGFFGKLFMFVEALDVNPRHRLTFLWLVGVGLLNSVVSAFYYARIVRSVVFRPSRTGCVHHRPPGSIALAIGLGAVVSVICGVYAPPMAAEAVRLARSRMFRPGGEVPPYSQAAGAGGTADRVGR